MLRIFRIIRLFWLDRILFRGPSFAFTDYFKGLEKREAVRRIFGARTDEVLRGLRVEFFSFVGYMGVNSANGHIMINSRYLNEGDRVEVYLDLIHELVHVRQLMEGKDLFDEQFSYVERPTEVEAYQHAVEEARRLGLSDERICQYLKTGWMSDYDLKRLAKNLGVKCA